MNAGTFTTKGDTGMHDVAIQLKDRPGALAEMGRVLGEAGISVEGGGAWTTTGNGIAHFLFENGDHARTVLENAGIEVLTVRDVLVQKLRQDVPGQLGAICKCMADAGVDIETLYSDHANRLILVVDDMARGRRVSEAWMRQSQGAE